MVRTGDRLRFVPAPRIGRPGIACSLVDWQKANLHEARGQSDIDTIDTMSMLAMS